MRPARRISPPVAAAAVLALALAGCSSGADYGDTAVPTTASAAATSASSAAPATCTNPTQSYSPLPAIPASSAITDPVVSKIVKRGYLRVGVSADTYLFGSRNPFTGQLEGFDIELARRVAGSLFGDPKKVSFIVLTAADRIPALTSGRVDMIARTMTMNCDRWTQVAFSSEYYAAGQKVLVTRDSAAKSLADLTGKKVCAPAGTSSMDTLLRTKGVIPVSAANHTGCLVALQSGKADAIVGDDAVLAGLTAQDPYAKVTDAPRLTKEPYGIAFNKDAVYLVRYVNTLLDQLRRTGGWKALYDKWLAKELGPAPKPPTPVYGRTG